MYNVTSLFQGPPEVHAAAMQEVLLIAPRSEQRGWCAGRQSSQPLLMISGWQCSPLQGSVVDPHAAQRHAGDALAGGATDKTISGLLERICNSGAKQLIQACTYGFLFGCINDIMVWVFRPHRSMKMLMACMREVMNDDGTTQQICTVNNFEAIKYWSAKVQKPYPRHPQPTKSAAACTPSFKTAQNSRNTCKHCRPQVHISSGQ